MSTASYNEALHKAPYNNNGQKLLITLLSLSVIYTNSISSMELNAEQEWAWQQIQLLYQFYQNTSSN